MHNGLRIHICQCKVYRAGPTATERQGLDRAKDANMSIEKFIDNEVKSNDVVLFMKGTPQFPQCGFSVRSCRSSIT